MDEQNDKSLKNLNGDFEYASEAWLFIWEVIKIVAISLAIILPIRYFVAQPFFVNGASMEPNFHNGDYLIVNEIGYRLNSPKRGDVVVFRFPQDPKEFFIKRIVGLPGETININKSIIKISNDQNKLGLVLDEKEYISPDISTPGDLTIKLDDNEYFVLGDNRENSFDSEDWGALNRSFLIGKAWVRLWPLNKIGIFRNV